ncbi:hypothetical protein FAUST_5460 [Fusarium austroamericanum]|uniref:Uncharacterized protein n=1 Tax=Fusarium austroamericanum TaxID=282268 RepID=A0AAN6HEY1_FUSAU|nr:hypothetical protein FAUST_5460 [Fusarium austroamericanum]
MVTHEEEADATLRALPTPVHRSSALKVQELTGQFPWEIADFCTETKWDSKLLQKFVLLILNCFPERLCRAEELSRAEVKRLRTAIYQQIEPKPFTKRLCLSQTDIQGAQRALKRLALQQSQPENDETASKDLVNQRKRSLSTSNSNPSATKRVHIQQEQDDPPAFSTRSYTRSNGYLKSPTKFQRPPSGNNRVDTTDDKEDEEGGEEGEGEDEEEEDEEENEKEKESGKDQDQEQATIEVHDSSEETIDLDQDSSPERRDVEKPTVSSEDIPYQDHAKDLSIGHGEVEGQQPIIESNPSRATTYSTLAPRPSSDGKVLVAQLSMSDKEIADTFRRNISFIGTRLQAANDKRLKDVETEYELCARKRQKAFDATVLLIRQLGQLSSDRAKIEEDVKKVDFTVEKTTASLVAYQELQAVGGGMRQISDMLDAALRDAISERVRTVETCSTYDLRINNTIKERDEAKASVARLDADLKEISQRRMNLQRSGEQTFQCNIRMSIDARDEDGHLFGDLTIPLEAIAREEGPSS